MVVSSFSLVFLLALCHAVPPGGDYEEETRFLLRTGLGNLLATFRLEEITISMMPRLTDEDLRHLGVRTIGVRINFRDAILYWTEEREGDQVVGGVDDQEVEEVGKQELGGDQVVGRGCGRKRSDWRRRRSGVGRRRLSGGSRRRRGSECERRRGSGGGRRRGSGE